jgi:hypothetical protein
VPQYLLSIYQPDGGVPDAETMARITTDLHRLNEELRESGSWGCSPAACTPQQRHRRACRRHDHRWPVP